MDQCTVALSANAGISVSLGSLRIWIDALHDTKTGEFSSLTPELWQKMQHHPAFAAPDYIIYTHCHTDHYSRTLTAQAKEIWPQARVILPEKEFPDQILASDELCFEDGGVKFRFMRLPHQGEQYASVENYGVLFEKDGFHILVAGDCRVCSTVLAERLAFTSVDLAILDFPWLTTRGGRSFIEKYIAPKHILIYHLPFLQEDHQGYRKAAEKSISLLPGIKDIRLLKSAFQTEQIVMNK